VVDEYATSHDVYGTAVTRLSAHLLKTHRVQSVIGHPPLVVIGDHHFGAAE
jgi:hypothetical protein